MKAFFDYFKDGVEFLKQQPLMLIGGACVLTYVPSIVIMIPAFLVGFLALGATAAVNKELVPTMMVPLTIGGCVVFAAGFNLVRVGWTVMLLKIARGQTSSFADFKEGLAWFMPFLLTVCGIGLASGLLAFTFIGIPVALFIIARTAFAPFIVVDEGLGPIDAMKRSNELVEGYTWPILGYYGMYMLISTVAGAIPLVQIVTSPAAMGYLDVILAALYDARKEAVDGPAD